MDIADHVRLDSHYADSLGPAEWVVCYGESLTRRTSPPARLHRRLLQQVQRLLAPLF